MSPTKRRTASVLILVVFTAVLAASVPAARAAGRYIDQKYGFAISLLKDWTQVPTQPRDQLVTAKFMDGDKTATSMLNIYRFQVAGSAVSTPGAVDGDKEGEGEGEGEEPGEEEAPEPSNPFGLSLPESAYEMLKSGYDRRVEWLDQIKDRVKGGLEIPEFPKPKKVMFKKAKVEGDIYIIEFAGVAQAGLPGSATVAGIVSDGTEEYLISYSCAENKFKKLKNTFIRSIRSFEFQSEKKLKEQDPEDRGKAIKKKDEELLDPEKRKRIKENLVGDWRYFDTRHYIVIYNCDLPLARYIANRVEYMRVNAFEEVFPPPYPIKECGVIRVCKEMKEYLAYGAPRGSAGYWSSGDDELVFPDLSPSKRADPTTIGVLHHEGFHQYVHYALAGNSPPIWFNEGFAEYFFCVSMKSMGKKLVFEKKHPMRYGKIKSALGSGSYTPVRDFIWLSQREHYSNSSLHYAEGWALCTWMMRVTRNERYRAIPKILFEEMQKAFVAQKDEGPGGFPGGGWGRGPKGNPILKAATEKAFEGVDIDQLEKDFLKDFKKRM